MLVQTGIFPVSVSPGRRSIAAVSKRRGREQVPKLEIESSFCAVMCCSLAVAGKAGTLTLAGGVVVR